MFLIGAACCLGGSEQASSCARTTSDTSTMLGWWKLSPDGRQGEAVLVLVHLNLLQRAHRALLCVPSSAQPQPHPLRCPSIQHLFGLLCSRSVQHLGIGVVSSEPGGLALRAWCSSNRCDADPCRWRGSFHGYHTTYVLEIHLNHVEGQRKLALLPQLMQQLGQSQGLQDLNASGAAAGVRGRELTGRRRRRCPRRCAGSS